MASYQDLAASVVEPQSVDSTATSATMQADMNAALENKQRTNSDRLAQVKSEAFIEKTINNAGDRVLDESQISRVIEMAWEDRTPFGAIEHSYGLNESGVIKLMRQELKPSSFRLWRQRVSNRATKHQAKRGFEIGRAYCKTQYKQR